MLSVCEAVEAGHEHDIVYPDLESSGNILYNPSTKNTFLTDYQGMQVKDCETNDINSFIAFDPIIYTPKY